MKTMQSLVRISVCLLFPLTVLQPQLAQAVTIKNCGKLPSVAVEDLRNIKAGGNNGQVYNNAGGHGGTKFPSIGQGQEYREYDVDANNPNVGNRGKYRFVALVTQNSGKNVYDPIYFTQNHYQTFCKV
jgi:guanyl-specific ribonuclease Sa